MNTEVNDTDDVALPKKRKRPKSKKSSKKRGKNKATVNVRYNKASCPKPKLNLFPLGVAKRHVLQTTAKKEHMSHSEFVECRPDPVVTGTKLCNSQFTGKKGIQVVELIEKNVYCYRKPGAVAIDRSNGPDHCLADDRVEGKLYYMTDPSTRKKRMMRNTLPSYEDLDAVVEKKPCKRKLKRLERKRNKAA